jgi:hypothetical protein
MPTDDQTNASSPSTTYGWRHVIIASPAASQRAQGPKGRRWRHLPPWNRRKKLEIKVLWRGGAEGWYQIEARGSMGRVTGDICLHDLMSEVFNER